MTKKEVIINKYKVIYYEGGSGRTVLFLHGGRARALTFIRFINLLTTKYRVIAPDIPGYGGSDTPKEIWSFTDYGSFFSDFIEKCRLTDVTVIGYSMGGGVALNLAALSKNVAKLILIDSSGIPQHMRSRVSIELHRILFYISHPQYLTYFFMLIRESLLYASKHLFTFKKIRQIRANCLETSYKDIFARLSLPTLILWGKSDWIYPVSVAKEFKKSIPNAQLFTFEGNHDWVLYSPQLFRKFMP